MVPHEQVLAFWDEMNAAGASWHFQSYSGVRHGFTDPESDARGLPAIAYDASADRQSWKALLAMPPTEAGGTSPTPIRVDAGAQRVSISLAP